jgi:hypothetical protein
MAAAASKLAMAARTVLILTGPPHVECRKHSEYEPMNFESQYLGLSVPVGTRNLQESITCTVVHICVIRTSGDDLKGFGPARPAAASPQAAERR